MRGYNTSEKPPGIEAYHIDLLAADVADLLRMFGGDEGGFLVGHDWGGIVAWHTAARYPELVQKLVVLNAPHLGRYPEVLREVPAQRRMSWYVGLFQLPWLPELLLPRTPALVKRFFLNSGANVEHLSDDDARQYAEALNQPGARTATLNYYRSMGRRVIAKRVRDAPRVLPMPTLVVWGKHDVALHIANADPGELRRWVPNLKVEVLETSHWVQNDAPKQVNELIVRFLG
jgi:pimeloyl-ACP methyl ester carboxylesterase